MNDRVVKLIRMLNSSVAEERHASLDALARALKREGKDFVDLATAVEGGVIPATAPKPVKRHCWLVRATLARMAMIIVGTLAGIALTLHPDCPWFVGAGIGLGIATGEIPVAVLATLFLGVLSLHLR